MIYLTRLKQHTIVSVTYYLLTDHSMMHSVRGHQFQLPNCVYKFHNKIYHCKSPLRFLKYFSGLIFFPIFTYCVLLLILILY